MVPKWRSAVPRRPVTTHYIFLMCRDFVGGPQGFRESFAPFRALKILLPRFPPSFRRNCAWPFPTVMWVREVLGSFFVQLPLLGISARMCDSFPPLSVAVLSGRKGEDPGGFFFYSPLLLLPLNRSRPPDFFMSLFLEAVWGGVIAPRRFDCL